MASTTAAAAASGVSSQFAQVSVSSVTTNLPTIAYPPTSAPVAVAASSSSSSSSSDSTMIIIIVVVVVGVVLILAGILYWYKKVRQSRDVAVYTVGV